MRNLSLIIFQNEMLLQIILLSLFISIVIYGLFHYLIKIKQYRLSFQHFTFLDLRNMIWITAIYTLISFTQFGSTVMPTTTWQPSATDGTQDLILKLPKDATFSAIYTFYGEGDNNQLEEYYQLGTTNMELYGSNDASNWTYMLTLDTGSIYQYEIYEGAYAYSYIWVRCTSKYNSLSEIGFYNKDDDVFLPIEIYQDSFASSQYPATLLIDEQDKLVSHPTYYDEGYFDEIYHPRNAYEIANGLDMYASVHPLLGTNIMALCIKLFGMSPFVWRLAGGIFGVLLVILVYCFVHMLFHKTYLSTLGAILISFDFMHITVSRIGTLEPFSVFFIIWMFYYMAKYIKQDFISFSFTKHLSYLLKSGIVMGLAIATKWTGCYSAVGLAILLFGYWIQTYLRIRNEDATIQKIYWNRLWKTILLCFVFFIFIPIVIYCISYIPDRVWKGESWSITNVIEQIQYMYNYHASLDASHPYSSVWYEWLIDARPIWYYIGTSKDGLTHTIACFSNPLLTWIGIPSIVYTVYGAFFKKDTNAWIITIGYFSALVPWMIITRCVFAYHFYPTSLFLIFAIVYTCKAIWEMNRYGKYIVMTYIGLYILIFILFLPITTGFGTTLEYIHSLEWFSGWYFG